MKKPKLGNLMKALGLAGSLLATSNIWSQVPLPPDNPGLPLPPSTSPSSTSTSGPAANGGFVPSFASFTLYDPGVNGLVDYSKYGKFYGIGTANYHYVVTDPTGLAAAVGEGIYPNTSVQKDPAFLSLKAQLNFPAEKYGLWLGKMKNPQEDFFRWEGSDQDAATKTLFAAKIFQQCKMWLPALKAYYALLVNFPSNYRANSKDPWTWYQGFGGTARNSIRFILREHPEFGLELKDCVIEIKNTGKNQRIVKINPGYFVKAAPKPQVQMSEVLQSRPSPDAKVKLVQYQNHHWLMMVDNKPYLIRGMCYGVTKLGMSPDIGNMRSFTDADNEHLHGIYDSWVDKNYDNQREADEPVVGDQNLLKDMGCNTIRVYYGPVKDSYTLDRFWKEAGIRCVIGVAFGAYGVDAGPNGAWGLGGTNYADPDQQQHILDTLKEQVLHFKDKPYTLCYVLGNENNYGDHNNSNQVPAVYCDLIERAVKMVHELDPNHPVGPCIGEGFDKELIRFAPDVDFIGINVYRGKDGMGDLWESLQKDTDRPVIITEFGAPAYFNGVGEDGNVQAEYLEGNWKDIWYNRGGGEGYGNALGGCVFQWQDEWWKAGNWKPANVHDTSPGQGDAPFADGAGHEEWYGVTGQGNGNDSPAMRQLRSTYYRLKELWNGRYGMVP